MSVSLLPPSRKKIPVFRCSPIQVTKQIMQKTIPPMLQKIIPKSLPLFQLSFSSSPIINRRGSSINENVARIREHFYKKSARLYVIRTQFMQYAGAFFLFLSTKRVLLSATFYTKRRASGTSKTDYFISDFLIHVSEIGWSALRGYFFLKAPWTSLKNEASSRNFLKAENLCAARQLLWWGGCWVLFIFFFKFV